MVNQRQRCVWIECHVNVIDHRFRELVTLAQIEHDIERWMQHAGAGVELDGDARRGEKERLAKAQKIALDSIAASGAEKSHRVVENILRSGKSGRGELGREQAVPSGMAGVQALGHPATVSAQTGA